MVTLHHSGRKVEYIQQIKVNETLIQIIKWDVCDYVYTNHNRHVFLMKTN